MYSFLYKGLLRLLATLASTSSRRGGSLLPLLRKISRQTPIYQQMRRIGNQSRCILLYASLCVAIAPSSLAIYPFENAPYSVAFIEESSTFSISHFAYARDKSGVASPRFPGRNILSNRKKEPYQKVWFFFLYTDNLSLILALPM